MFDTNKFQEYQFLFSANGKEIIKGEIINFRKKYGEKWREEFVKEFPAFAEIISLVVNFNAESAFIRLKQIVEEKIDKESQSDFARIATKAVALTFLDSNRLEVLKLHAELFEVIHRKQF